MAEDIGNRLGMIRGPVSQTPALGQRFDHAQPKTSLTTPEWLTIRQSLHRSNKHAQRAELGWIGKMPAQLSPLDAFDHYRHDRAVL